MDAGVRVEAGKLNRAIETGIPKLKAAGWAFLWFMGVFFFFYWLAASSGAGWWGFFKFCIVGELVTLGFFVRYLALAIGLRTATIQTTLPGRTEYPTLADMQAGGMIRHDPPSEQFRIYWGEAQIVDRDKNGFHRKGTGQALRQGPITSETNALSVGPPGSGKTMRLLVPNIAHLCRSMVIMDPKGQLAAMTARKRSLLGPVYVFDPYLVTGKSDGYNPLALVDKLGSPRFVSQCDEIAEGLIEIPADANQQHWTRSARELVCGLVMWECVTKDPDKRSLGSVRANLCRVQAGIAELAKQVEEKKLTIVSNKLARFNETTPEIHSIISSAITELAFLDDDFFINDLKKQAKHYETEKTFRFEQMKEEFVTVYIILPTNRMDKGRQWMRMLVASAIGDLTKTPRSEKFPPVLMIFEEFKALGRLDSVANNCNTVRDFGLTMWFVLQALGQLRIYGHDWENIVGSCGTETCFRPEDLDTAQYFSRKSGITTEMMTSEVMHHRGPQTDSYGQKAQSFPLYTPDDLYLHLPEGNALVLSRDLRGPAEIHAPGIWEKPSLFHPCRNRFLRVMAPWAKNLDDNPYKPGKWR